MIALEYDLVNDNDQFKTLCSKYLPTNLDHCSLRDQKCILYGMAPAMFYYSSNTLFSLLERYITITA